MLPQQNAHIQLTPVGAAAGCERERHRDDDREILSSSADPLGLSFFIPLLDINKYLPVELE